MHLQWYAEVLAPNHESSQQNTTLALSDALGPIRPAWRVMSI
jgi:hypothetical protein